jgi:hypothetical protein
MFQTKKLLALAALVCAAQAQADGWSFANVSVNYLAWSQNTLDRTNKGPFGNKKDFAYLELEGGKGGDWGDVYGFFDLENATHASEHKADTRADRRTAAKVVGRYNLAKVGDTPVQLYAHVYDFRDNGFYDQNRVLGLGTALSRGNFWIKPFLGVHQELKSNIGAEVNGGMGGWVLGYNFQAFGQPLMLTQWHETEFGRKDKYLTMADGGKVVTANSTAQNGAVSLWWTPTKRLTAGVSYRYALNKLGVAGYESGLIYTMKYNF